MAEFDVLVNEEVQRARHHFPGQEETLTPADWVSIITEEVGEVARELNERLLENQTDNEMKAALRVELVQVAAMCWRMYDSLRSEPAAEFTLFPPDEDPSCDGLAMPLPFPTS